MLRSESGATPHRDDRARRPQSRGRGLALEQVLALCAVGDGQVRQLACGLVDPHLTGRRQALDPAARIDVERQQLGVLDHRHRMHDAGRDPEGARRRNDGGDRA